MRPVPKDILDAATVTATLELQLGADIEDALRKALEAALITHERHLTSEWAERVAHMAEDIDDPEEDMYEDGPAALMWLARVLHDMLPADPEMYQPTVDDFIEVILYGTVVAGDPGHWTVFTADFQEIEFTARTSKGLQVRLIRRDTAE